MTLLSENDSSKSFLNLVQIQKWVNNFRIAGLDALNELKKDHKKNIE